ncbi:hypothetical protein M407DRAFT_244024 [Tulasnella calospora MUT 4182]|uniref:tRNA-splicing endonuclease subunit Sen15 domain-containing protein n=1 Tax=Tulasnella calospora MUT 4182 TaxID=1051891 RepID=A0A0C3QIB0_9AGAM|nr:hypothetical protein M407DRAFT_244024 [Tulasnella calospora MUT 4182]
MESHSQFDGALKEACTSYPRHAGSLFQAYNDLKLAQKWTNISIVDIPALKRSAVRGDMPAAAETSEENSTLQSRIVVPCTLSENLSIEWINTVFDAVIPPPSEIYLGIVSDDSSIVYYKLSKGMVKPPQ